MSEATSDNTPILDADIARLKVDDALSSPVALSGVIQELNDLKVRGDIDWQARIEDDSDGEVLNLLEK